MRVQVIGAGVAGSYAALGLAEKGHEVNVFDAKPGVIEPRCAEGV